MKILAKTEIPVKDSLIVLSFAIAVFFGCIVSPPVLMDDVDSVNAQIARNMLESGEWVIAHLDGVPYLEKSPLIFWLIAFSSSRPLAEALHFTPQECS